MKCALSSFGPLNQFIILQESFTPNSNTSSLILLSASGAQYGLFFRLDCSMWLEGKSLHIFNLIELLFIFQKMSENEIRYVCSQLLLLLSCTYIIYLGFFFFQIEVLIFIDWDLNISSLINQQERKSWKNAKDCSENERKHKNNFPYRWPLKSISNWDCPCPEVP